MIVLDETEHSATVVRLMKWRKGVGQETLPAYMKLTRGYLTGSKLDKNMVLDLRYCKTVDKTDLFLKLPDGGTRFQITKQKVDELLDLARMPWQEQKLPQEIEDRRMTEDAKLEVGSNVEILWGLL